MDNHPIHLEFTHVSWSPVLINIPDVFSCRLQCVLRYTWNEYTHSFSKDTSNEYTRSFCRHMNRKSCNAYSHSLTTHEMHIHMYTQCFLRTGCDFVATRVCILVAFFRWYPIHSVFDGLWPTHHASLRSTLSFAHNIDIDLRSHCVWRLTRTVPLSPSHTSRRNMFLCITPRSHSVFFIVVTV